MRKAVPIVVVLLAATIVLVARSGVFKKESSVHVSPNVELPGKPNAPAPAADPTTKHTGTRESVPRPKDPAVAAVMDEMLAAWSKLSSVHVSVETFQPDAAGHEGRTIGKGEYYLKKLDGQLLIHFDLRNDLRILKPDGGKLVTGEVLIWTIDGKHLYTFVNQPGPHKEAIKKKLDYNEVLQLGGPHLFTDLVTNNTLSVMPEEMLGGFATKVIKAKPNDGNWEAIHYFDKVTGLRVGQVESDETGKTTLRVTITAIDTDSSFSDDKFKFVVPEGVTLEDQTRSQ